jgi:hypothetical protein
VTGPAVRNGVAPERVYRRPFEDVWSSLAKDSQERTTSGVEDVLRAVRDAQRSPRRTEVTVSGGGPTAERRPVRVEVADGRKPLTEAVAAGERRAQTLALTDVELAVTHTVRERLAAEPRIKYYRRVLTGAESCGLCVIASTQRYRKRDLLPIHPNCDCVVAPILGDEDPGQIINSTRISDDALPTGETRSGVPVYDDDGLIDADLLSRDVHDAIRREFGDVAFDARGIDYRKILLVEQHGELGPVLTVARHKFTKRQIDQRDLAAG